MDPAVRDQAAPDAVRKQLTVRLAPDAAFDLFTAGVGTWWPTASHSVGADRVVACVLESGVGGRFYERLDDGTEHDWGEVTAWDPPRLVRFTWHPGRAPSTSQVDAVTFAPAASGGTTVTLVHTGWDRLGERAVEQRDQYVTGWDLVFIQRYGSAAAGVGA